MYQKKHVEPFVNLDILKIYLDRAAIKAIENSLSTKLFAKKVCKSKDIENRLQCQKTDPSGNN